MKEVEIKALRFLHSESKDLAIAGKGDMFIWDELFDRVDDDAYFATGLLASMPGRRDVETRSSVVLNAFDRRMSRFKQEILSKLQDTRNIMRDWACGNLDDAQRDPEESLDWDCSAKICHHGEALVGWLNGGWNETGAWEWFSTTHTPEVL